MVAVGLFGNLGLALYSDMLILASASPRRHELLLQAGIPHLVRPSSIPENRREGEDAAALVVRLAREKAFSCECDTGDIVLGADTVVCLEGEVFGKPLDDADAALMLRRLSGRDHWVYTGVCLRRGNVHISDVAQTRVWLVQLSDAEIEEYTLSGEPRDKAGAYAIQGLASKFVCRVEGCYQNVVGLPVSLVYSYLKTL